MKPGLFAALFLIFVCSGDSPLHAAASKSPRHATETRKDWILTWNDEFNGPDGSVPDAAKWTMLDGGNGWGNNELEYYATHPSNVHLEHGNLVLQAVKESYQLPDGTHREYTSARLSTEKQFSQKYGRFEARIRVPKGQGMWPAFWLLGEDFRATGWPDCGEIDIMENSFASMLTVNSTRQDHPPTSLRANAGSTTTLSSSF